MNAPINILAVLFAGTLLTACAPARYQEVVEVPPPAVSSARPSTEIYFYPNKGQSARRQDRDRYECYLWAVDQSGFDPSSPLLAPHQRVRVVAEPPAGHDTATGAVTGAVLGAVIGAPHNSGGGAVIGALAGAALGASSDAERQNRAAGLQEQYDRQADRQYAAHERQADNYRRAMSACLEGRGYTVR